MCSFQGRNIRQTFESVSSVFSPSCISHTVITKPDWTRVRIGGVSLPDAIQCWVGETMPGEQDQEDDNDDHDDEDDGPTEDHRLPSYSLTSDTQLAGLATDESYLAQKYASSLATFPLYTSGSAAATGTATATSPLPPPPPPPMMANSPAELRRQQQRFRVNANLVRSIGDVPGGGHQQHHSNSMNHRIRKVRHRHNITDNRTGGGGGQQLRGDDGGVLVRCRPGDPLEKKIRCAQEENRLHLLENTVERTNRDLVRSLGAADTTAPRSNKGAAKRNQTKRRKRRRRKKRRQIHIDGEELMTKEERRLRRREERQRLKRLEKKRRKEKMTKEEEVEVVGRRRRKRSGGTCRSKLVDTCSWPQCNRSCPKLHNPVTGQHLLPSRAEGFIEKKRLRSSLLFWGQNLFNLLPRWLFCTRII